MSKELSSIWFLKDPIDNEYKNYILLDYLKNISYDLTKENAHTKLKKISKIVRILNDFRLNNKIDDKNLKELSKKDKKKIESFDFDILPDNKKNTIHEIVLESLELLYEYSDLCLDLIKTEEDKIKIFKVGPDFNLDKIDKSGVLIIRNMITDKLINYYFKCNVKVKQDNIEKEISILKKINLKNSFFSMNYEYIYNEILVEAEYINIETPHIYVIEIYDDFEETSEIYKMAKEKFIEKIS